MVILDWDHIYLDTKSIKTKFKNKMKIKTITIHIDYLKI